MALKKNGSLLLTGNFVLNALINELEINEMDIKLFLSYIDLYPFRFIFKHGKTEAYANSIFWILFKSSLLISILATPGHILTISK